MTEYVITLKVNQTQVFDTLHKMNGDCSALGQRLSEVCLAPANIGALDRVGLSIYGIEVQDVQKAEK